MTNWPKINIDTDNDLTMCFACGRDNPIGLKLKVDWDGTTASTRFTPSSLHQGWSGAVHGGIISCLLDEVMTYAPYSQGINTITAKMQLRFRNPAPIDQPLIATGSIINMNRKLVKARGTLSLEDGTLIANSTATMYIVGQRQP